MSETKFTPAPWGIYGRAVGVVSQDDDQSNGMMLSVCWIDQFDFPDSHKANAYLIAAAPEMYDFIKKVFDIQKNHYGYAIELHMAMIKLAEESELLLAKARGEL
jgi:hypothetical protein